VALEAQPGRLASRARAEEDALNAAVDDTADGDTV
jgi:hypothetical protein